MLPPARFLHSLTRLALAALLLTLAVVIPCSCGRSSTDETKVPMSTAQLDSTIRTLLGQLYNDPALTIRRLDSLQRTVSDTASRLHIEIFKTSALALQGDTLSAIHEQQNILTWCRTHPGHEQLEGLTLNHRGVMLIQRGNYAEANVCLDRACKLLTSEAGVENVINAHINSADAHMHYGQLATAAERYRRAHFLADSTGLKRLLPAINAGLGLVYVQLENFKMANQYLDEAEADLSLENDYGRFFFYTTRGNCYFFERRYNDAIVAFNEARKVADRTHRLDFVAQCDGNIGEVLFAMGNKSEARTYIARGEAFARQHPGSNASLSFYLFSLALDIALDDDDLQRASQLLTHDLNIDNAQEPRYRALHYRRLSDYARRRSDWQGAYRYNQLAQEIEDTLKNNHVLNTVAEIRTRYDQDTTLLHQRYLIADYAAQTSHQRSVIAFIVALVIICASISFVFLVRRHRSVERRQRLQVQQMGRLRMNILQNRMQPHYVFNVLGTILPRFSRYPELSNSIGLLIDSLRANLLALDKPAIPLSEELGIVTKYVELHHLTHDGLPNVTTNIAEDIPADAKVPTMCLQIPVENALKHAFPHPTPDDRVDICATYDGHTLTLTVLDNGVGYNPSAIPATGRDTGTGLRVLSRTIEVLNTHNAEPATFDIRNRDNHPGTIITFRLPMGYNWEV